MLVFEYHADPALCMPTAVAVAPDGAVYVADGVHDRILAFTAEGAPTGEIRAVGAEKLLRPLSVKTDGAGRLWIADTGNGRVLVRGSTGDLERMIVVEQGAATRAPDITDLALSPDGRRVWLVDNDNHRVIRVESESGAFTSYGERGESPGQFQYPFMLALDQRGKLYVTEVVNARIQVLGELGEPAGTIGTYGADVGQLYRPKGVACDVAGDVWVADSTLGVVQVFAPSGRVIDVLRDEQGEPLRFQSPSGITFDRDGNLYVAELTADRVRKVRIAKTPQRPREPAQTREADTDKKHSRSCTICHLPWLPALSDGRGTALLKGLSDSAEDPIVSRGDTCLSCHDGSVVDSRRRVWQEHGHRIGIKPPGSMKVPSNLPLVDGRIACRTCHAAHASGTSPSDLAAAMFLRVPNAAGELCVSCHGDQAGGPALGTHPTGPMPLDVPPALLKAGARAGAAGQLICQVCHTPHGAVDDRLLVLGTETNQLCLSCHAQTQPGLFPEGGAGSHPLGAPATPAQAAAAKALGTSLSPEGRLLCLSCHKPHHAKGDRYLLAAELKDGQMCLQCHADRGGVRATAHDLRASFPEERNALGMTAGAGGPCSACHLVHRSARPPEAEAAADAGRCVTCHQPGGCAQTKTLGPISHPAVKCGICHDPHEAASGNFLRRPAAQLCNECHDFGEEMSGAHTFENRPDVLKRHGEGAPDTASCLVCHSMHQGVAKPLWGAAPVAPKTDREKCTVCHQAGGMAEAKAAKPFSHPLACTTCHNPHADGGANPALLVVDPPAQNLCIRCHEDNLALVGGPHDFQHNPAVWPAASAGAGDRCLACHRLHSEEQATLFRNGLAAGVRGRDAACLACHPKSAWDAESDIAARHARRGDLLEFAGDLPLVPDPDGAGAQIGCRTCHNPHTGKGPPAHLVRVEEDQPGAALCQQCHQGKERIESTGHSGESLQRHGLEAESCQPCHVMHGDRAAVAQALLWAPQLEPAARLPGDQRCRGCHRANGPAKPPTIFTHPEVMMWNTIPPDDPGFLPLFNERGEVDPRGRISCPTCHLPHGRPSRDASSSQPAAKVEFPELGRAMRVDVRPYMPPVVCNTCHGQDAIRRFLYFHDPVRGQGPLSRKAALFR